MTQATIAAQIHQPLDVHGRLAAKVAFDDILAVDRLTNLDDFRFGELIDPAAVLDAEAVANFLRVLRPDAVNVTQRDMHALRSRDVDASDLRHANSPVRSIG